MGRGKVTPVLRLLEVGAVVLVVVLLVGLILPNFIRVTHGDNRSAQCKQNLHSIQLAAERYAVDNWGNYPVFLIGGEARNTDAIDRFDIAHWQSKSEPFADLTQVVDPLVREGYMPVYPQNPFVGSYYSLRGDKTGVLNSAVHLAQLNDPLWPAGGDPLRNGNPAAGRLGTRFGAECGLMGQVLGDSRWLPEANATAGLPNPDWAVCAGVKYPYWDIWSSSKPKPFLPGEFFYRSDGERPVADAALDASADATASAASATFTPNSYLLGVYGKRRTKGQDILDERGDPWWIPPGSPGATNHYFALSPPAELNGIPDAIIFTLGSGFDT